MLEELAKHQCAKRRGKYVLYSKQNNIKTTSQNQQNAYLAVSNCGGARACLKENFEIQKYKLGPQLMQKPHSSFEVNEYTQVYSS